MILSQSRVENEDLNSKAVVSGNWYWGQGQQRDASLVSFPFGGIESKPYVQSSPQTDGAHRLICTVVMKMGLREIQ